jgi:signal transduction histidine kinase
MRPLGRLIGPSARLLIAFIILAAGLVALTSSDVTAIRTNGSVVQVAGKLRLDAQRTFRWLAEVSAANPAPQARAELARNAASVRELLTALDRGGSVTIAPGNVIEVRSDAFNDDARRAIAELETAWRPIATAIAPLAEDGNTGDLRALAADVAALEPRFNAATSAVLGAIGNDSLARANRLRNVGGAGALTAIGFFLLLIWLYSRQIRRVEAAKQQTDDILAVVPAGLFLLDRDGRIGAQHSARLSQLLQARELGGRNFFDVLGGMVGTKVVATARDFVEILFGERVHEDLVGQLNPLDEVEVMLPNENGRMETRFLGFGFRRVRGASGIAQLMVTVSDVTDRVRLARALDEASSGNDNALERMLDLLVGVLRQDPGQVRAQLARWRALVSDANNALKRAAKGGVDLHATVNEVFRPIHSLKSESAALALGTVAQRAAAVEHELADLRTRPQLVGNDFMAVAVRLDELLAQFDQLGRVIERLQVAAPTPVAAIARDAAVPTATRTHDEVALLERIALQVAAELGKRVRLEVDGVADAVLSPSLREAVHECSVQLVRNAIAHGIEDVAVRQARGKAAVGRIEIRLADTGEAHVLSVTDDGGGIDFDEVRRRAVAAGRYTAEAAAALGQRELAGLLFEPGFSTGSHGEAAGRGVGLDLVRTIAQRHGGRVALATADARYTRFTLTFPRNKASEARAA